MTPRRQSLAVFLTLLLVCCACGQTLTADERFLHDHSLKTDAASLFAFLRDQASPTQPLPRDFDILLAALGDPIFAKRDAATRQLIDVGPAALERLRAAESDDPETRRRLQHVMGVIETRHDKALDYFVVRQLLATQPPGTVAALFDYLPFADADTVEEIWYGLEATTTCDAKLDAAIRPNLSDAEQRRRALAAFLLARHGTDADRAEVRPVLNDRIGEVRLRAAQGLLSVCDRSAVLALTALLKDGPLDTAWQAEELLRYLAGHAAPKVLLGDGKPYMRQKVYTAWHRWWRDAGPHLDWEQLDRASRRPGLLLLAEAYQVQLLGCDGVTRWHSAGLRWPSDVRVLSGPRLLIADATPSRVTEYDFHGHTLWSVTFADDSPGARKVLNCQRLPNGNTIVVNGQALLELGRDGTVLSVKPLPFTTPMAERSPDGRVVAVTDKGLAEWCCGVGKTLYAFPKQDAAKWKSLQALPLAVHADGTSFVFDEEDQTLVGVRRDGTAAWKRHERGVLALAALRNGNVMVIDGDLDRLLELDARGQVAAEVRFRQSPFYGWDRNEIVLREAFPLLRLGFERSAGPERNLDSVDNRLRGLAHPDPWVRAVAAYSLMVQGPKAEKAIPALVAALDDSNAEVRQRAAAALGAIGPAAVADLLDAVRGHSPAGRAAAWKALESCGPHARAATPTLAAWLAEPRESLEVRRGSAAVLRAIGLDAAAAIPALLLALQSSDDALRATAASAVAKMDGGSPKVVAGLSNLLKDRRKGGDDLANILKDRDVPDSCQAALSALDSMKDRAVNAWPQVADLLLDPDVDPSLRLAAARALVNFEGNTERVVTVLGRVLTDRTQPAQLRRSLCLILGDFADTRSQSLALRAILIDLLREDQTISLVSRLTESLGADAVPLLMTALPEATPPHRQMAITALGRMGRVAEPALALLETLAVQDEDADVRRSASAAARDIAEASREAEKK